MLSHGVTNSMRSWFHQLELLPKEGFRTIAFDHRGHGQSVVGTAGHSLENLAEDMRTVVEGLDLHDAILVGHSMGGVAVQAFVTRFPEIAAERVAGIVLLSTLAKAPLGSLSTRSKQRIEALTNHAPDMTWLWTSPNFGFSRGPDGFRQGPAPESRGARAADAARLPAGNAAATRRARWSASTSRPISRTSKIPTLVVVGTSDVLTPPAQARMIAKLIPGARMEVFPGGGHMLMLERVDELNRLIIDFAREVGATGATLVDAERPVDVAR